MRWLVVSATEVEAAALPKHDPAVLDVLVTGAGKVASAVAVASRLTGEDPAAVRVLNIGTAGGLRDGASGVVVPSTAWAWDFDAAGLRGLGIGARDTVALDGGAGSTVASGDAFVACAAQRSSLARRASIVDMECYAVAWAARSAGFGVTAAKWVSDRADDSASADWAAGVREGAAELGNWVRTLLA